MTPIDAAGPITWFQTGPAYRHHSDRDRRAPAGRGS